jgi:hypothetical protein
MRGDDIHQDAMFSYLSPEARVPKDHPLRPLQQMVNRALRGLSPDFHAMYLREGRPSISPEKLLRALLLQVLYTIHSEMLLMEQPDYNLPFRRFVGLSIDDKIWDRFCLLQESGALSPFGPGSGLFRMHPRAGGPVRPVVGRALIPWTAS